MVHPVYLYNFQREDENGIYKQNNPVEAQTVLCFHLAQKYSSQSCWITEQKARKSKQKISKEYCSMVQKEQNEGISSFQGAPQKEKNGTISVYLDH
uniref:Uncharacterized protein n=1 Tax=Rhizophora mucronata TaxID=61149 RepID=A0A2P2LM75_RHIMU